MSRRATQATLLGAAFILLTPGCSKREPVPARAELRFAPARLELGTLTQNEPGTARVELFNAGQLGVRVSFGATSDRCRSSLPPMSVAPNAKASIAVVCQSDLLGPLREQLTVKDAATGNRLATLPIVGRVEPIVGFDTGFVDLRTEYGKATESVVHLIGSRAREAIPRVTSTGDELVTVAIRDEGEGKPKGLVVTCRGDRVGMHAGSLLVDTGLPRVPSLALSWGCRVPATLDVSPSTPYFNLRVSGERDLVITVKSSQPGFRVHSVSVVEGPFVATLGPSPGDGTFPVFVKVDNRRIPDDARAATGRLVILSNDQREPTREVPLFGFGRVNKAEVPPEPAKRLW